MTDRVTRLARISVQEANLAEGQISLVGAEIGPEEQARARRISRTSRPISFRRTVRYTGMTPSKCSAPRL